MSSSSETQELDDCTLSLHDSGNSKRKRSSESEDPTEPEIKKRCLSSCDDIGKPASSDDIDKSTSQDDIDPKADDVGTSDAKIEDDEDIIESVDIPYAAGVHVIMDRDIVNHIIQCLCAEFEISEPVKDPQVPNKIWTPSDLHGMTYIPECLTLLEYEDDHETPCGYIIKTDDADRFNFKLVIRGEYSDNPNILICAVGSFSAKRHPGSKISNIVLMTLSDYRVDLSDLDSNDTEHRFLIGSSKLRYPAMTYYSYGNYFGQSHFETLGPEETPIEPIYSVAIVSEDVFD